MPNVLTVLTTGRLFAKRRIAYSCVLSGNYVQAANGGEVLILDNATGKFDPMQFWGIESVAECYVEQGPAGYTCELVPVAGQTNQFTLKVFSSGGTELAAGAYPAAILADTNMVIAAIGASYK